MDSVSVRYRKGVWMDGRISVSLRFFVVRLILRLI